MRERQRKRERERERGSRRAERGSGPVTAARADCRLAMFVQQPQQQQRCSGALSWQGRAERLQLGVQQRFTTAAGCTHMTARAASPSHQTALGMTSLRQSGQAFFTVSQVLMQAAWKTCPQRR